MRTIVAKIACAVGVLAVAGSVNAANPNAMTISGNSFADFSGPGGAQCVSRQNNGISNGCTFDSNFSYGIPKGPSTAGYTVTFEGTNYSSGITSNQTLFSNAHDGTFLTYFTNGASASGNWSRSITFTAAQAPASGRLTAIVGLPANYQAAFYGVTVAY
jgi:hypothetical protein